MLTRLCSVQAGNCGHRRALRVVYPRFVKGWRIWNKIRSLIKRVQKSLFRATRNRDKNLKTPIFAHYFFSIEKKNFSKEFWNFGKNTATIQRDFNFWRLHNVHRSKRTSLLVLPEKPATSHVPKGAGIGRLLLLFSRLHWRHFLDSVVFDGSKLVTIYDITQITQSFQRNGRFLILLALSFTAEGDIRHLIRKRVRKLRGKFGHELGLHIVTITRNAHGFGDIYSQTVIWSLNRGSGYILPGSEATVAAKLYNNIYYLYPHIQLPFVKIFTNRNIKTFKPNAYSTRLCQFDNDIKITRKLREISRKKSQNCTVRLLLNDCTILSNLRPNIFCLTAIVSRRLEF